MSNVHIMQILFLRMFISVVKPCLINFRIYTYRIYIPTLTNINP